MTVDTLEHMYTNIASLFLPIRVRRRRNNHTLVEHLAEARYQILLEIVVTTSGAAIRGRLLPRVRRCH